MGETSCEQSYNFNFKDWDRDGCGDAETNATSRRRPESASDGCKIVRSVSRFCSNYPGFTHRRRIANDLWLSHNYEIYFSKSIEVNNNYNTETCVIQLYKHLVCSVFTSLDLKNGCFWVHLGNWIILILQFCVLFNLMFLVLHICPLKGNYMKFEWLSFRSEKLIYLYIEMGVVGIHTSCTEKYINSCTDLLIMLDILVIDMPKSSNHINAIKVVAFKVCHVHSARSL